MWSTRKGVALWYSLALPANTILDWKGLLRANTILDWKGLLGANTLAYYKAKARSLP